MADAAMMPEESEEQKTQRMAIIEAFASLIKEHRKDAIEGRAASGIERVWAEDDAHYDGEDDSSTSGVSKGSNLSEGLTDNRKKSKTGSTVFLKITRPYCDSAAARVADMLLPTDDRNWALRPTPLPQMIAATKDTRSVQDVLPPEAIAKKRGGVMGAIKGMFSPAQPGPEQAPPREPTVAEVAKQAMDKAKAQAEAAQDQIDDWLVECRYHAEVRKVIESSAKLGTGILKGPVPTKKKVRAVSRAEDGSWTVEMDETIRPGSKCVSVWKLYPDPNCGDDIHKGSFVFEEDDLTARGLTDLKGVPGYITEMIDLCLEEGPTNPIDGTRKLKEGQRVTDKDLFQIWYFHGQVSRKDMEAAGCKCGDNEYYPCMVTMVNDRVIRVSLSTLNSGEFPYDVMVWQAQADHWAGVGVARQMRECQKGANAAIRNIMDNAGLGAGPQIIVDRSLIAPANGKWVLTPRKIWWTKEGAEQVDASKAFHVALIPIVLDQLMPILQFWLKEAEDVTGLPMLIQGQQGKAPETVGGMTMLNNNATSVLRRIARTFDDRITEPHIGRYYEYLLLHGENNDAKGEFSIDARGSSALIERDTQSQQLMQMVGLSKDPAYGLDPELVLGEVLKGMRFDLKRLTLSDEKKQQIASQPQPKAPQVEAAEIREKGASDRKQMELQADAKDSDLERQLKLRMKEIDAELAREGLSEEKTAQLQDHKVDLATLAMKLRQQRELSPGPQVLNPPTEPAGRAANGMAFPE